mmetsp:Transcript_31525/g.100506  ORF Transcript_31525/g.100506 Transcript_31525/m.100506 type:complete len:149 (-) Transcript_31525:115-561(-)
MDHWGAERLAASCRGKAGQTKAEQIITLEIGTSQAVLREGDSLVSLWPPYEIGVCPPNARADLVVRGGRQEGLLRRELHNCDNPYNTIYGNFSAPLGEMVFTKLGGDVWRFGQLSPHYVRRAHAAVANLFGGMMQQEPHLSCALNPPR